jgi:MraZ protein
MRQFTGEYEAPVDDKGRIFVPAEVRRNMPPEAPDELMVVKGFEQNLYAYPLPIWKEKSDKLRLLPQTDPGAQDFKRGLLSQACQVTMDRQGRATISRRLLGRVGITDRMVIVGMLDWLELWSPADYESWLARVDGTLQKTAARYKFF